jgi:hypothetical protein
MSTDDPTAGFNLIVDGEKVDGRSPPARRFRSIARELAAQLARNPSASERILITNAATLAMLCERATAALIAGEEIDQAGFRQNASLLGQTLIKIGLAKKSRDITKRDQAIANDDFGSALIEANEKS